MNLNRIPVIVLITLAFWAGARAGDQRGVPAAHGIANFGQVDDTLWRGAQPDETGLRALQKLGVATVINLRMPGDVVGTEEAVVRQLGLRYFHVPLPGLSAPKAADVARVLALIAKEPGPVFVHCEHGADRTGTIVACYRILRYQWTADLALTEAKGYGMSFWEFGMKDFVRDYRAPGEIRPKASE